MVCVSPLRQTVTCTSALLAVQGLGRGLDSSREKLTPLTLAAARERCKTSVITKTENQKCYGCPVKTAEIILAVISGMLGGIAALYSLQNKPRHAAVIGGIGLLLCNIVWLLRLL
jgi:hypothetical protein